MPDEKGYPTDPKLGIDDMGSRGAVTRDSHTGEKETVQAPSGVVLSDVWGGGRNRAVTGAKGAKLGETDETSRPVVARFETGVGVSERQRSGEAESADAVPGK
jgi:hypothetical protein